MMTPSKLKVMADTMRKALEPQARGWRMVPLPGGLQVLLARDGEAWRLALRRVGVDPSDIEGRICAQVFGVAEGTEPRRRVSKEVDAKTRQVVEYRILEFSWREYRTTPEILRSAQNDRGGARNDRSGGAMSACAGPD